MPEPDSSISPGGDPSAGRIVRRRRTWLLVVAAPVLLVGMGLLTDLGNGLPIVRDARSVGAGLAGVAAVGALYVVVGAGAEAIHSRDSVDHPLWKRVVHLTGLLILWGALLFGLWALPLLVA
jgi:hypothetical protein